MGTYGAMGIGLGVCGIFLGVGLACFCPNEVQMVKDFIWGFIG
jgi:hypothetical protein